MGTGIPRRQCIVCHGSGEMPDLEDSSRLVECEFCEPEETMDRNMTLTLTGRQIKEIYLALFYTTVLNHGTDGHHRLNLISAFAQREGFYLDVEKNLVAPPHVVEVTESRHASS